MLVLVETAAGYGLVELRKGEKMLKNEDIESRYFGTLDDAKKHCHLKAFRHFEDMKKAVDSCLSIKDSKMDSCLQKFLKKNLKEEKSLVVCDKHLGKSISSKFSDLKVIFSKSCDEVVRGIRRYLGEILECDDRDMTQMRLGLSHSISRFKIKFSPDKIDTMIMAAVGLLDDLDKELNNFAMRLREWYSWHFPELAKLVPDQVMYAEFIQKIGMRETCRVDDLQCDEELKGEIRQASKISMGTEITEQDLRNILDLAHRVVELGSYRRDLSEYLRIRMEMVAPNLTNMVGELIAARLIAKAGSLLNLAKHPASTVQILGAEKALFRALKTKQATPKYGLIYHASLVGSAQNRLKGKMSRMLAAKLALCARVDALREEDGSNDVSTNWKRQVEKRLQVVDELRQVDLSAPKVDEPVAKKRRTE